MAARPPKINRGRETCDAREPARIIPVPLDPTDEPLPALPQETADVIDGTGARLPPPGRPHLSAAAGVRRARPRERPRGLRARGGGPRGVLGGVGRAAP